MPVDRLPQLSGPARASAVGRPCAPRALAAVVFVAGAGSLSTEICASRVLAPYFGNSTVVWANVIGLILIYLCAGYWLGGRLADRRPRGSVLGSLLVGAALSIAVLPFTAHPFLGLALRGFSAVSVGAVAGSFFATLVLFSLPVTLLGMTSPFAVRLAVRHVSQVGSISGRLSSLATLGAIAGTFGAALLLIPAIGTQRTLLVTALLVALAAVPLRPRAAVPAAVVITALALVSPVAVKAVEGAVVERETSYQYLQVVRNDDGRITLRLDDGVADQSVYRPESALTGGEWDMPLIVPPLLDRPLRRVLVIGNAGGTTARALAAEYPGVAIDGVELDPHVTEVGRRYLGMSQTPGLKVTEADGRAFLRASREHYDMIVVDAYRQAYVPFHLVTQEFFRLARDHLSPGGAIAFNVERVPGDDRLARAVSETLATVFPQVWSWPALRFNELILGLDHRFARGDLPQRLLRAPLGVQPLAPLFDRDAVMVPPARDPLTDDRAPVEWLTDRALLNYIAAGGRFDERLLPTHP